jgi:hypothetical protein
LQVSYAGVTAWDYVVVSDETEPNTVVEGLMSVMKERVTSKMSELSRGQRYPDTLNEVHDFDS